MGYQVEMIDYREERDNLEELLQKINADLVIVGRGDGIPPTFIDSLRCPTLLWYGEHIAGNDEAALARLREVQYNAGVFDYVIWFGEEDLDSMRVLRDLGCNRIGYVYPCRFDQTIYRKLDLPKIYDVSFVGSLTPRRKQILETLARRFKVEFRNIWDVEEQVRFYNQSKIVLHINFAPFIATTSVNMRAFDIMGSGAFMLHEDVVFHKQFEDSKHLAYWHFNDVGNLVDKIEYYLTHEEERERIAAAGYRYVRENFSVDKTIQELLNQVDFSLRAPSLNGEGFGIAFDKWGRQTCSVNELHKALEPVTSAGYAHSFYERGRLYFQLQRWQKAAEFLEQSVEKDGHFISAMYLLALSYQRLNRLKEAVRELSRLLKVAPLHAEANLALGELYLALGDAEEGKYYKQKGSKLTPKQTS
jgi:tetratricopeptide (TPR) repeat protein